MKETLIIAIILGAFALLASLRAARLDAANAAKPRRNEQKFLFSFPQYQPPGGRQPQHEIADNKAGEKDLDRAEAVQQGFGGDKGGAPDKDRDDGGQVSRPGAGKGPRAVWGRRRCG
mgnify:CR=1 FL=1